MRTKKQDVVLTIGRVAAGFEISSRRKYQAQGEGGLKDDDCEREF